VITGAHVVLYSTDPDADRAFLRDVLRLPNVDVGGGWLIFALPPSEVAVHPADENGGHELYFLVDDLRSFISAMRKRNIPTSRVSAQRWGRITQVTLPGGGKIGVYEPRHARPDPYSDSPAAGEKGRRVV
jgi:catechol 2,3-dioxygenase-like lactoylglutathione lyase family enzyme